MLNKTLFCSISFMSVLETHLFHIHQNQALINTDYKTIVQYTWYTTIYVIIYKYHDVNLFHF